jgi:hypothetical protein
MENEAPTLQHQGERGGQEEEDGTRESGNEDLEAEDEPLEEEEEGEADEEEEVKGDADEVEEDDESQRQSAHNDRQALRADLVDERLERKIPETVRVVPVLDSNPSRDKLNHSRGAARGAIFSSAAPSRRQSGGNAKKPALLASEFVESTLRRKRVPLRPVIDERPASNVSPDDEAVDLKSNEKVKNASKYKKGPYDGDEIATMEAAFEQSRHSLNFSHEQMQMEIANWGRTKPNASYKIPFKQALPDRNLDSIREFCQRHFHVSRPRKDRAGSTESATRRFDPPPVPEKEESTTAFPRSTGPFTASEKRTIEQTLDETLQSQSLSRAEFLSAVYNWKGPLVQSLLAALATALPQRSMRSLRDHIRRTYPHKHKVTPDDVATDRAAPRLPTRQVSSTNVMIASLSATERISDAEAGSQSYTTGRPLLAVVIPAEEAFNEGMTEHVVIDSASSNGTGLEEQQEDQTAYEVHDSNKSVLSNDDLPANDHAVLSSARQYLLDKRPVLQQPTPVTSSANVSGPESAPCEEPKDYRTLPEAPRFAAEDHLRIFDLGDYHDILKENVVVLSKNAAIANFIEDNSDLGAGNERFWQAMSDAMLQSKLISIGNPAGITQIRRLAYRTATQNFQFHPATGALQNDDRCHPRQKMESLIDSILTGAGTSAKLLPRMWRHDLIDCTREEIAWIQYSEELEKAKVFNKACGEHDQSISKLGRNARKRLRRAWSRVQTETEKARELAGKRYAKDVNATVTIISDPPTEFAAPRAGPSVLPQSSQIYTSDADDGPVYFRAAHARSRRSSSENDLNLDDGNNVNPATERTVVAASNNIPSQRTQPLSTKSHRLQIGSHRPKAHASQTSEKDIIIPDSQPDNGGTVIATKSKKRPRESSPSENGRDHVPINTAAAKLKARHAAKKAKVQAPAALPSPYVHPIPTKAVKQNLSKAPAAQRRAYGDMSRETFLEKCRAGGN